MTTVGKYQLATDFTMAGGGQCRWAFARKGGEEFFLKEFLTPTYPLPDAPGSPATKRRKLAKCQQFSKHHVAIMEALKGAAASGGNLVTTREFFRHAARYYKVTDKVDVSTLSVSDVHKLDVDRRLILVSTVAHSLEILHRVKLVHGDLKPANVLLKETAKKHFAAKLIDFDDAYFAGNPAPPDELIGDIAYYSPETQLYVREEAGGEALLPSSDIFALGVLFNEYFTGHKPVREEGSTVASVVLGDKGYRTGLESSWPDMDALIRSMLAVDSRARPTVKAVKATLKSFLRPGAPSPKPTAPSASPTPTSEGGSRLRGKLIERTRNEDRPPEPSASSGTSRLKGALVSRSDDRRDRRS